jgi:acyl-coenzyme A synthetase/AMP-(fatty) acid ligase
MTDWNDLLAGQWWQSEETLWVEDDIEYSAADVGHLASAIEEVIRRHDGVRVVRIRSDGKLGCFAGQLAAWRAGCVAVADDGNLGPSEIDHVRPDLSLTVALGPTSAVEVIGWSGRRSAEARIPGDVVAVNFTSGSTGSRKAIAVTRGNLQALFDCRDLDVPVTGRLTSASFATPTYDGWWFDTWRTISAGGTVVCLPNVNEDVFAWPELAGKYDIDRVLLPAAVIATIIEAVPSCIAGIPTLFSGGEQFQASTYRQARMAGLKNRFVNLYGPSEATFATHKYELPESLATATIPIGKPLDGCQQSLHDLGELEVAGPFVCLGYLKKGGLDRGFHNGGGRPSFLTGDVMRLDDEGNLVFAGRLDSQIKVNGMRVDAAALEHQVTGLPEVVDCRVVQDGRLTVAFVRVAGEPAAAWAGRFQVEAVVKSFSPAITVRLLDQFPMKSGGKVDTVALMDQYHRTNKDGEK